MTKIEALMKCTRMWDWLAEHRSAGKAVAHAALFPGEQWPLHGCFACEYTIAPLVRHRPGAGLGEPRVPDCRKCPMWEFHTRHSDNGFMCEADDSPYRRWAGSRGASEERAAAAKEIADLARQRLTEEGCYAG